jgi:hypothetical protein
VKAMSAPRDAACNAISRPIRRAAPVMNTILPERSAADVVLARAILRLYIAPL